MDFKRKTKGVVLNRLIVLLSVWLLWGGGAKAQSSVVPHLSDSATVSLLTYSATDEIHAMYGHTALRVKDPAKAMDWIFNYGMFDFSADDFLMRFVLGQTDYQLGVYPVEYLWAEAQARKITLYEQILNLNAAERQRLFDRLMVNLEPQNRTYRYNFLFDNCSTRLYYLIRESVEGRLNDQNAKVGATTFREAIYSCVGHSRWVKLGIDIILGGRIDRPMTYNEQLFLPRYLQERLRTTRIEPQPGAMDAVSRPLVANEQTLVSYPLPQSATPVYLYPMVIFGLLFAGLFLISWIEWNRGSRYRWVDVVLFMLLGIVGMLIHFMIFFSEHPAVSPNWNGVIINPLFLLMGVGLLFANSKVDRVVAYLGMVLSLVSIGSAVFAPQQMTWFVLWVSVVVMIRSLVRLKSLLHFPKKRI